ncbi:hypothetical protein G6F23_015987 [Rhizopus arrhizus]|nr:hypothetical protein G6F23_015987 [Rhizopus arrhizus]
MLAAAAAASSTSAAFCCVTVSICATAWFTCPIPEDCSSDALAISRTRTATWRTLSTTSRMVRPASST